jgi:Uma2 family endonuclease
MATTVLIEEGVEIPLNLGSLEQFRKWTASDDFPEQGRIDFLTGRIEVDMSPEDLFTHGTLKTEFVVVLGQRVKQRGNGHLFTDSTRVSCPDAGFSVEPDIVFISHEAVDSGRVRLIPKASGEPGRYIEVEGPPDLIVEIVSDRSVTKDTERLPRAYFQAGVREFWLADARHEPVIFRIHRRGTSAFQPVDADSGEFQSSTVLCADFQLDARRDDRGHWAFDLREKNPT